MADELTDDDAPFLPDWVSPPGDTIDTLRKARGWSLEDLALSLHKTPDQVSRLIDGTAEITPVVAMKLARVLGSSVTFWMRREFQYRQELIRLGKEAGR